MIEMGKQYRTRDGREVRIYAVDAGGGKFSVHGAFNDEDDGWTAETWTIDGQFDPSQGNCQFDLIEVRPPITRTYWLAHYNGNIPASVAWMERPAATFAPGMIAITGPHEITFTEGEGLSTPAATKEP